MGPAKAAMKAVPKAKAKIAPAATAKVIKAPANGAKKKKPRSTEGAAEAKAAAKMTTPQWKALQVGMDKKWPAPAYVVEHRSKAPERSHTSYLDETYEIITRWKAETKISYRPHAKAPGSKSHIRYEHYSKAKTVGEALKLGTYPADWCWDYERGFIQVKGPVRDEPLDISKILDEKKLSQVDVIIHRWYRKELAKNLGLKLEDLQVSKGGGESTLMRAHRLVANREATKRLAAAAKAKRPITPDEVLKTLQEWAFARNPNRTNVLPNGRDWVWSDTIGLLRDRMGDIHLTRPTERYPEVTKLVNKYLTDRLPKEVSDFKWTSINLNCDYAAKLHRDGNNFGPSFISAVGDFTGGELCYFPEDDRQCDKLERLPQSKKVQLPIKDSLALFNGNCGHSVNDFKGNRFSIVYFTCGCYDLAPKICKDNLEKLGFSYPKKDENRYKLLRKPLGYAAPAKAPAKSAPAYRLYSAKDLAKVKPTIKQSLKKK
eukprot:TRINITY_DN2966_c0_g2_i1.p1 TRINITY_DN2966_c0_g2~~TRINITY_DN2966_c0_g2_i1.p1  ORF type:complete len:487 (-),score=123.84 TRINITY_DN2966_c0_g2_i1:185-1645(-)